MEDEFIVPRSSKEYAKQENNYVTDPKLLNPDGLKAYIYIIKCKDKKIKDEYIGSTKNFDNRCKYHIRDSWTKDIEVYRIIRANGYIRNWEFEILYHFNYYSDKFLLIQEQRFVDAYDPTMNTYNASNLLYPPDYLEYEKLIRLEKAYKTQLLEEKELYINKWVGFTYNALTNNYSKRPYFVDRDNYEGDKSFSYSDFVKFSMTC
jgi:hypothetical protein